MSAAAKASGRKYVVAVAGATGNLGIDVVDALLSDYSAVFPRVLALVRDRTSKSALALVAKGVEVHQISTAAPAADLLKALAGVDALVDVLSSAPDAYTDALVDAAVCSGVRVYFPSEYGVDRRHEYWGYAYPLWTKKDADNARARARAAGTQLKIIQVYTGLFLKYAFSPIVGLDHAKSVFTVCGSPAQRLSWTSEGDIGRALAELALRALDPATAQEVPEHVRVGGDTLSVEEAARVVEKVRGDGRTITVKSEDLERFKKAAQKELEESPNPDFLAFLRLAMAKGELDLSDNQNELVNPGESVFKWKTLEAHARENKL